MRKQFKKKIAEMQRQIAKERISILWNKIKEDPLNRFAPNYAKTILRISKKYRVKLPKSFKKKICPKCFRYLVPGKNCKVRVKNGERLIICECGHKKRQRFLNIKTKE